jgi:hypothetical protein
MDKKNREDEELSVMIDRLLAGEQIQLGTDASEDLQAKLKAAQEIVECGANPAPAFQANLKTRLVNELAAKESTARDRQPHGLRLFEFLGNLIPAAPVWRTSAVTITVGIMAFLIVWATGLLPLSNTSPDNKPPLAGISTPALIEIKPISTGAVSFHVGITVKIDLVFKNLSSSVLLIEPFPPSIQITLPRDGELVRTLAAGSESSTLRVAGDSVYSLVWDQLDDNGLQVAPGTYSVSVNGMLVKPEDDLQANPISISAIVQIVIEN